MLQRQVFATIEHAFADEHVSSDPEHITSVPPPPSQAPAPQSPWEAGYVFIDFLKAEHEDLRREVHEDRQETRSQLAVVRHDQQNLTLRVEALEARDARPTVGLSPQRLAHIYVLARRLRAQQGYRIADLLKGLTDHFQVEDVSDLPESAWPAILAWFASLLED